MNGPLNPDLITDIYDSHSAVKPYLNKSGMPDMTGWHRGQIRQWCRKQRYQALYLREIVVINELQLLVQLSRHRAIGQGLISLS